mmetsp:Transcript_4381/g.13700  ORF Transcript_4381/g.13700 Transcript_4381/m.13700 type:complete len:502 (-) Transcript_4381:477-1982(-)
MLSSDAETREQHAAALLGEEEDVTKKDSVAKNGEPAPYVPPSSWLGPRIGNFSVQYNFQCIAIVLTIAERTSFGYPQRPWVDEQSKSSVFVGCILGQMIMGYFGDVIGRGPALGLTLSLAVVGALASAIFPWGQNESLYSIIVVCRFIIGFGLGGVYPLSATQASEASGKNGKVDDSKQTSEEKRTSAMRTSQAFFWQAPGTMAPYLVAIILRAALKSEQQSLQWRLILGLGAVPSAIVVLIRCFEAKAPAAKEKNKVEDSGAGASNTNAVLLAVMKKPKYWRWMTGTGGCWFLLDVTLYGFGLMGPYVVSTTFNPDESIENNSWQQFVALFFTIPAVLSTMWLISIGYEPKFLQYLGFYGMTAAFVIFFVIRVVPGVPSFLLYVVYCLINFATWFGTIVTTFLLPAATYPKATRASLNGLSSAISKLGAIVGTEVLPVILDTYGLNVVVLVNAAVALLGALLTHLCVDNVIAEQVHYDPDELGVFTESAETNSKPDASLV